MVRILRPRVLVLTTPVDPTADMVLTHLHSDGVPFLRLDAAQFPTDVTLTSEIGQYAQWRAELNGVSLDEVKTIYYRRPGRFKFDTSIPLETIPCVRDKHASASGECWNPCPLHGLIRPAAYSRPNINPANSHTPQPRA